MTKPDMRWLLKNLNLAAGAINCGNAPPRCSEALELFEDVLGFPTRKREPRQRGGTHKCGRKEPK